MGLPGGSLVQLLRRSLAGVMQLLQLPEAPDHVLQREGRQRRNTPAIGTSTGETSGLLDQPAMISTGVPALVEAHDNCEVKVPRELNEEAVRPR